MFRSYAAGTEEKVVERTSSEAFEIGMLAYWPANVCNFIRGTISPPARGLSCNGRTVRRKRSHVGRGEVARW